MQDHIILLEKFKNIFSTNSLIFFLIFLSFHTNAKSGLQFQFGDRVSIFAEKKFVKNNGKYFEAVGNVVVISGKDTLYGESASFDMEKGIVEIEGNVRFINKDLTIYGASIHFNATAGTMKMKNARVITSDFTIVAKTLKKNSDTNYFATEAEFTTCKDCVESWTIFGKEIDLTIGAYVTIKHGMVKIKGVNALYIPYIALPVKSQRETGLLFPRFVSILPEGIGFQQPFFWAMSDDKDMTITPSFWASRGFGTDYEYRQAFGEKKWVELNSRMINDGIFHPDRTKDELEGQTTSDTTYMRHFTELESHMQWSNNITQHFRFTGMKDLEFITDQNQYMETKLDGTETGLATFIEGRSYYFNLGTEVNYKRNVLYDNVENFDDSYVQILPKMYMNTVPFTIYQSSIPGLQNITLGMDTDYTVFKQMESSELDSNEVDSGNILRNAKRLNAQPYLKWSLFTLGPFNMKTKYRYDYQEYKFFDDIQDDFQKDSGVVTTEFSFLMDRVFGLAYEENIPMKLVDKKSLEEKQFIKSGRAPVIQKKKKSNLVGGIPEFEKSLTEENFLYIRNSYRHSQEFKLLHHKIVDSQTNGNELFETQIQSNIGQFDYIDAIREQEFSIGSNENRKQIPLKNTMEFQWNNSIIKKIPRQLNYFNDNRYLRDNFTYQRVGHFNFSQGYVMEEYDLPEEEEFEFEEIDRLTRLFIDTGYRTSTWNFRLKEYYFHKNSNQILNTSIEKKFNYISVFTRYSLNTVQENDLKVLGFGFQFRPIDVLGFSTFKEQDITSEKNIRSTYQVDYMPNNNCWILNLNYSQFVSDSRFSFNFVFNFGNESFVQYRNNYFSFDRLK